MSDRALAGAALRVGRAAQAAGRRLATAESCTGGWIAKTMTDIPGSSAWFEGAVVSYSNAIKIRELGVSPAVLASSGAVSRDVVEAMAAGVCRRFGVELAVAVSGVAGPGGGTAGKPVGLVWFAWHGPEGTVAEAARFDGDREAIRRAAVGHALERWHALLRAAAL